MCADSSKQASPLPLSIYCLGGVRIELDGAPLTRWASRKAEALLVYLAVTRQSHERESLATLLWDDRTSQRALGNLSVLLSSLRKNLGERLRTTRQSVGLDWEQPIWVDAHQLTTQLGRAGRGDAPGRTALARLQTAVELYQGDFLAGFHINRATGFEEWSLFQREHLRHEMVEGMESLCQGLLLRGRTGEAITFARHLLALDPLRERGHRLLMRLLAVDGQRTAALAQYDVCFEILHGELGVEPDEETTALYEQIAAGDGLLPSSAQPDRTPPPPLLSSALPQAVTSFVGRLAECSQIQERLENPACRLLTLVGPGGVGKTRLALQAAQMQRGYLDGVWFAPLEATAEAELASAIGAAVGCTFTGATDPGQQLIRFLSHKEGLLVLDNFEHLVADGPVALISRLLAGAPDIQLLVTSRAPLDLQAEWLQEVGGLPFPVSGEEERAAAFPAVQLFVDRATSHDSRFRLDAHSQPAVVRICQLVGGFPLTLELAAAWLRTLPATAIADEIERSLDFLVTTRRDLPERQRSPRAVFDSSWRMLAEEEQELFRKLSVFRGGFSREGAEAVCAATLPLLSRLVNSSLLWRNEDGRYHRHPLLNEFAAEKLASDPELEATVSDGHCRYYVELLEATAASFRDSRRPTALALMDAEIDNVRRAWRWATAKGQGERLAAMSQCYGDYLVGSALFVEGRTGFARANDRLAEGAGQSSARVKARLLTWQSVFERVVGAADTVHTLLQRALSLLADSALAEEESREERAFALHEYASHFLHETGDYDAAEERYQQALALYTDLDDRQGMANVYNSLGVLAYYRGDYEESRRLNEESLRLYQASDNLIGQIRPLQVLGLVAASQGRLGESVSAFETCLTHSRHQKYHTHLPWLLADLGYAYLLSGEFVQAQTALAEGLAAGNERQEPQSLAVLHTLYGLAQMHAGAYAEAQEQGNRALSIAAEWSFRFEAAFAQLLLGSVAFVRVEYRRAREMLAEAATTYRAIEHIEYLAWALPLLAWVACADKRPTEAAGYLAESAELLAKLPAFAPRLLLLASLAAWHRARGEGSEAGAVSALLRRFPLVARSRWFADLVGPDFDGEKMEMPAGDVTALDDFEQLVFSALAAH